MKFTYSSGQRPLDGYTIKRGIGKGGFGEVYYALSDGGKEVALKLIRSNFEVELRGITQCLNLKHPNLVNLFDLRTDAQGDHWVVMEYVAGEPLNVILERHPNGVGQDLAAEWFAGLAAAIGYLHDHGIVHRDLKSANIFVENGAVKVGDYGLCKFMAASQRSGQTQSIGTVHYMAPEISTGNYNRQIDIYAAGILLYEMLTGHVPFEGESAGEILMKHLTTQPDLSKVPTHFVPIVDKALQKNPATRYRTMGDMARDVGGLRAPKVATPVPEAAPVQYLSASQIGVAPIEPPVPPPPVRTQLMELGGSMLSAVLVAAVLAFLWAAITRTGNFERIAAVFFLSTACTWAVIVPAKWWAGSVEDSWRRRMIMLTFGLLIGVQALWLQGYSLDSFAGANEVRAEAVADTEPNVENIQRRRGSSFYDSLYPENESWPVHACYLSYFGLALFAMRWWRMADRNRMHRFSLASVFAAAFWGYVLFFLLPVNERPLGFITLVMTAVIVQIVSPWRQAAPARSRRLRLKHACV